MSKPIEDITNIRDFLNEIIKDNKVKEAEVNDHDKPPINKLFHKEPLFPLSEWVNSVEIFEKVIGNDSDHEILLNLTYEVGKDGSCIREGEIRDIDGILNFLKDYGYLRNVNILRLK